MSTRIPTITSADVRRQDARVAVLPVGSFEQHGDFLPLATDTLIACAVARRLTNAYDLLLLPPVTLSCSHEHHGFPGTVSITATTLAALVGDVMASLAASGIHRLAIVNGHGGNYVLANVVQQANVHGPRVTLFPAKEDWRTARADAGLASSSGEDMHGGELETSILLHTDPELVREGQQTSDHVTGPRTHLLVTGLHAYTGSGVAGRPSLATAAKGEALLGSLTRSFAAHLDLLG